MHITPSLPLSSAARAVGRVAVRPRPAEQSPAGDRFQREGRWSEKVTELGRDFGINPLAMARRALVEKPLAGGSSLPLGVKGSAPLLRALQERLHQAVDRCDGLATLEAGLKEAAASFGVRLIVGQGVPTVNWDSVEPAVLDVSHHGGPAAFHEMVHVAQCVIGAASALGQAASQKFVAAQGREPATFDELKPFLSALTRGEKAQAMQRMVKPMESLAYSRFEETAFHVAGMNGRKSKDLDGYKARLKQVVNAFVDGYLQAQAPRLETGVDARVYGGIAHIARTHGETSLLLLGAGAAYYGVARAAMRVHPALGLPLAAPLGYVLYRALVSG